MTGQKLFPDDTRITAEQRKCVERLLQAKADIENGISLDTSDDEAIRRLLYAAEEGEAVNRVVLTGKSRRDVEALIFADPIVTEYGEEIPPDAMKDVETLKKWLFRDDE